MRLPLLNADDPESFDYPLIEKLFDTYMERGFTYFDAAYTYHGYHCEEAVKKALVERHPRDSFELATKLPLRDFKDAEDMERIFNEQLEHCDVEYFDYYLLHNMGTNVYDKCRKYDAFGFAAKKKEEGRIRYLGMSFHDMPELLDEILEHYGELLDFVQLQINYVDWEQPNVQSRRCLEVANKYHKPVFVMEPCKGGTLVQPAGGGEEADERICAGGLLRVLGFSICSQPGGCGAGAVRHEHHGAGDGQYSHVQGFQAHHRGGDGCHPPGDRDHREKYAHPLYGLLLLHPRMSEGDRHP